MLTNLWAGSTGGLDRYMELCGKFFQASHTDIPLEASSQAAKQASLFEVTDERIGLNLIERQGQDNASFRISGSLVNGHAWWHQYTDGEITSYDAINDAVSILEASGVKNVLLNIESQGGQVTGVARAAKSLARLGSKTNVKVHIDNFAMSAGIWLAVSPKSPISASEMAQVGSIGVFAAYPDYSEQLAKEGIRYHVFSAGREKGFGFGGTPFTVEEKESIQKDVDTANNFFLTHVSTCRNLMMSETDKWAEAQTFYAGEAKAVGLIDQVADLEEVLGSFTASKPNGDKAMLISEEKMARIFAGEAPETVLTSEELAHYMASNQPAVTEEPAQAEPVAAAVAPDEPVASAAVLTVEDAKAIGRLEAKLEIAQEANAALAVKVEALQAETSALLEVAQVAVTNLQVALQQPKESKSSAAGVLAQFNDLQAMRIERFKPGRKSSASSVTQEPGISIPNPLRPN